MRRAPFIDPGADSMGAVCHDPIDTEGGLKMSRRWFVSVSGPERLDAALEFLRGAGPCVVIAPRKSVADELVWNLAEAGQPTSGVVRTTPAVLAGEFASIALAAEGRATVGSTAVGAVLTQAVDAALSNDELRWFRDVARLPGFAPSLQRTLEELRFAGVSAAALRACAQNSGEVSPPVETARVVERAHLRLLSGGLQTSGGSAAQVEASDEGSVLLELAALAGRYENELQRWSLADRAWIFARAIDLVTAAGEVGSDRTVLAARLLDPVQGIAQLWLDVPLHSVLEQEFFAATSGLASDLTVITPTRDRATWNALELSMGSGKELGGGAKNSRLKRVQRSVFASDVAGNDAEAGTAGDESFAFFSSAGEGQEAVEIARRVGALAEEGISFDEVGVFLRQTGSYVPLIEDAFTRAQIPAYFARGSSRPDPSGRAFLALLACADEGLSATRFAEFLSFDQLPLLDSQPFVSEEQGSTRSALVVPWVAPDGDQLVIKSMVEAGEAAADVAVAEVFERAPSRHVDPATAKTTEPVQNEPEQDGVMQDGARRAPPAAWERLIVDAAVVGGADRWRRRLRGLAAELERRAREVGEDEPRSRSLKSTRKRLQDLEAVALPLVERLASLPVGASWADWLQSLEQLAVAALRFPRSVLAVLAELRPMAAVGDVSLTQVQKVLSEPLRSIEAEPPKRREGRVFVGGIEQARGRSFRVVFVPGLAEGVFPARASEDPLLLDVARLDIDRQLSGQQDRASGGDAAGHAGANVQVDLPRLPVQSTRFHRERLLLRLAIGAASDRLIVSYPRIDVMLGRARVPSFYALDLLRAAEGRIPTLNELARRAATGGGPGARWPAPERAEDAIDDAEFDLALLHPSQQEPGAARFLLFANEHLKRSLHARARRWRSPFTWADGLVIDDAESSPSESEQTSSSAKALALLENQRPHQRSFSPTALQHFSACPYRFLLQAIHRLRPKEDRAGFEQLDPLTRGSLFHDVQFLLFQRLRTESLLPVTSRNLKQVLDLGDVVLDTQAAQTYEEMAPAIERIWLAEIESLRNDLRGWLRQVSEQPQWRPALAEMAFGLAPSDDRDAASVEEPVEVSGFRLRGSIDLVEVSDRHRRIRVTDHKTGRAAAKSSMVVDGGKVLQPVLYGLVAEQLLQDGQLDEVTLGLPTALSEEASDQSDANPTSQLPEAFRESSGLPSAETAAAAITVESGRLFYCTVRGGYADVEVPLRRDARQSAEQLFETVDAHIREGFLPAAPAEGACRFCDYRIVCGPYEERRIQRKQTDRLDPLTRLRRLR